MLYAVTFYGAGNKEGLPAEWPKEAKQINSIDKVKEGQVGMTQAELDAHIAAYKPAYDAAVAATPVVKDSKAIIDEKWKSASTLIKAEMRLLKMVMDAAFADGNTEEARLILNNFSPSGEAKPVKDDWLTAF